VSTSARNETAPAQAARSRRIRAYLTVGAVLVVLAAWGAHSYREHAEAERAQTQARSEASAQRLQKAFAAAGLPIYGDIIQVSRTLGTDGGAVCEAPDRTVALGFLKLQLSTGDPHASARSVAIARQELAGERLIIRTYCPEKVGLGVPALVDGIRSNGTAGNGRSDG
jgi:hypothetical protein